MPAKMSARQGLLANLIDVANLITLGGLAISTLEYGKFMALAPN